MTRTTNTAPPPPFGRDKIGRYDVVYPVASGGMATVYVGRLSGMAGFEKLVALKVIHSHLATQKQFIDMFLDEARLAARIHHPNIGEIYEVVEDNGKLFIAGEFVAGQSLRHLIRETRREKKLVSNATAAWIVSQVCQGLHYVHDLTDDVGNRLNLVHRDISPSNILISYDGWIKLIDFGVAFAENRRSETIPGNVKGTLGFIAPELLKGAPIDPRADIFSLGVVLYQLATSKHPFAGKNDAEKFRKILNFELASPSSICPSVAPGLERIILKAMAESPENRYQTAAQMEAALKRYIATTGEHPGATELAQLMQSLFAEEKALHHDKLAAFRLKKTPKILDVPSISREEDITKDSLAAVFSEPPTVQNRFMTLASRQWRIALVATILILFAMIIPRVVSVPVHSTLTSAPALQPKLPAPPVVSFPNVATHLPLPSLANNGATSTPQSLYFADSDPIDEVEISFTTQPAETELLVMPEGEIDRAHHILKLSQHREKYTVLAAAPGYATQTFTIVPKSVEPLSISLSPLSRLIDTDAAEKEPSKNENDQGQVKDRKRKHRKANRGKRKNQATTQINYKSSSKQKQEKHRPTPVTKSKQKSKQKIDDSTGNESNPVGNRGRGRSRAPKKRR